MPEKLTAHGHYTNWLPLQCYTIDYKLSVSKAGHTPSHDQFNSQVSTHLIDYQTQVDQLVNQFDFTTTTMCGYIKEWVGTFGDPTLLTPLYLTLPDPTYIDIDLLIS